MDVDKLNQAAELDRNIFSRLINAALANPAKNAGVAVLRRDPETDCLYTRLIPTKSNGHPQ